MMSKYRKMLAVLCFIMSAPIAYADADGGGPPPTKEMQTAISSLAASIIECSAGTSIKIDGNLDGSVATVLNGDVTNGKLTLTMDNFLFLFPEGDRIEALRIYSDCLKKKYIDNGSSIDVLAISSSNKLTFADVSGKPRAVLSGDFGAEGNHVYEITPEADCNLVLVPDIRNLTSIGVTVQEVRDGKSTVVVDSEILADGEVFSAIHYEPLMFDRARYIVSVKPLSRASAGLYFLQFGRKC